MSNVDIVVNVVDGANVVVESNSDLVDVGYDAVVMSEFGVAVLKKLSGHKYPNSLLKSEAETQRVNDAYENATC